MKHNSIIIVKILSCFFSSPADTGNLQPTPTQSIEPFSSTPAPIPLENDQIEVDIDRLIAFKNTFSIDPRK